MMIVMMLFILSAIGIDTKALYFICIPVQAEM
jgi:hypothetical protein